MKFLNIAIVNAGRRHKACEIPTDQYVSKGDYVVVADEPVPACAVAVFYTVNESDAIALAKILEQDSLMRLTGKVLMFKDDGMTNAEVLDK